MTVITNTSKYVMNFEFLFRHKIESGKFPVAPPTPIFPHLQPLLLREFHHFASVESRVKTHTVFTQNDLLRQAG